MLKQFNIIQVGSSCMQGWRIHMEDSHTHILSLPDDPDAAFFAVYDGHGGSNVAEYAGKHLHKYIVKQPSYKTNIAEALKQVSVDIDLMTTIGNIRFLDMSYRSSIENLFCNDLSIRITFRPSSISTTQCEWTKQCKNKWPAQQR